jgi:hypothetical protein
LSTGAVSSQRRAVDVNVSCDQKGEVGFLCLLRLC